MTCPQSLDLLLQYVFDTDMIIDDQHEADIVYYRCDHGL